MPLYDSAHLFFSFDIAPDSAVLAPGNACTNNWVLESEDNFSLSITYDKLRDDCKLNGTSPLKLWCALVSLVFLMSESMNSQIDTVAKWLFPLEAEFQHKAGWSRIALWRRILQECVVQYM